MQRGHRQPQNVFKDVPKGLSAPRSCPTRRWAGRIPGSFRPAGQRETPCECERPSQVSLNQALNLINGPSVGDAVADPDGRIAKLILKGAPEREIRSGPLRGHARPPAEPRRSAEGAVPIYKEARIALRGCKTSSGRC